MVCLNLKSGTAGEACRSTQVLFDAKQLVVFGNAIGARERTSLNLSDVGCHRKIGNERIFRFA
jgi:hypothetical protein